jgi:hypothetical protein
VTPDQVTLACLVVGLAGAHCFLYARTWLDVLGFVLLVLSDVLDSADGQLARLRGTSTPFGRILDGIADNARFTGLYVHVLLRLVLHGGWGVGAAVALTVAAGLSHSWQSAAVDCIRHAFLELGVGRGSELELPEDLAEAARTDERAQRAPTLLARAARAGYAAYVRRQEWLCPAPVRLVRRVRALGATHDVPNAAGAAVAATRAAYRARQGGVVRQCAWLGQNIRWLLVGAACTTGHAAAFLWITAGPLNLALVLLLAAHERRSSALLAALVPETAAAAPAALAPSLRESLGGGLHAR